MQMIVKNTTNNRIITRNPKTCKSTLSKAKGLMFAKKLTDSCLILVFKKEAKISLHMFFVFFPIDIIFLDSNFKVVGLKQNVKPFTPCITSPESSRYIIELPESSIIKSKTRLGHKIVFKVGF